MSNELYFYDIFPKVVPVNKPVDITIRSLSLHTRFDSVAEIRVVPINGGVNFDGELHSVCSDGIELHFTHTFQSEQEYQIRIFSGSKQKQVTLTIYALAPDLMECSPLIGDFHAHSFKSDGQEGPDFVAARYREEGFDFTTITDHRRYQPSQYAKKAYENLNLDFKIYHGEEIHTPDNCIHLVNFASDSSVNAVCLKEEEVDTWRNTEGKPEWFEAVAKLQAELPTLPEGIDPFTHASCLLAIQKVRERNGMCILAHPHWRWNVRNVPDVFTKYYLENSLVDAFEVIGGQTFYENNTQLALYNELRAEGCKVPIVGSSDSHGTVNITAGNLPTAYRMFTEEKTMVFAKANSKEAIISAVKWLQSVAIEQYTGESCRIYGPYRMVQYASFLMLNFFPLQDKLCAEEGRLMREYINGSDEARERLTQCGGQTAKLRSKYFC